MKVFIIEFLVAIFCYEVTLSIEIPENFNYEECSPHKEVCHYWLTIKEKLTMIYDANLVYAHRGKLYKYNEYHANATTEIPIDKVVTVDGVNRMVIAVNETIPGPPIVVYENQRLIVHVKNSLLSNSVTIHWHGLHQKGTPFMDGVGWISQCPIGAGQTFTYNFTAKPKGTFWYHSHVGAQRSNGVYGALVIKEKPKKNEVRPIDVIMTVGDWRHHSSEEEYTKLMYGNFHEGERIPLTPTFDGSTLTPIPWISGLIEGKGRYTNHKTGKTTDVPLTWYKMKIGKTHRFRVINVGGMHPMRISIDEHNITVIASDGYDIKPRSVESFFIFVGERFDFLFTADKEIKNYWLRAQTMEVGVTNHLVQAVIHYEGASNLKEPLTKSTTCSNAKPCNILNCGFSKLSRNEHVNCIKISDLEILDPSDTPPIYENDSEEYFFNFVYPFDIPGEIGGTINGRRFELAGVNSLKKANDIRESDCNKHDCDPESVCYCHHEISVPFNKTIQMIWLNMGKGNGEGHPIHFHGHSFYLLKMGYAPQNDSTGKLLLGKGNRFIDNEDIECIGEYCNKAKWKNSSWNGDDIPGLNLKNPPRKDTINIPTGGYAVLRIKSNNPGKWFIHCHIEAHMIGGMAMILGEAVEKIPGVPPRFPLCNNFYNNDFKDTSFLSSDYSTNGNVECEDVKIYVILIAGFGGLNILLVISLIFIVYRMRKMQCCLSITR